VAGPQVLLDFLVSDETRMLEYLTRLVRPCVRHVCGRGCVAELVCPSRRRITKYLIGLYRSSPAGPDIAERTEGGDEGVVQDGTQVRLCDPSGD
jgi:hypothetical protein